MNLHQTLLKNKAKACKLRISKPMDAQTPLMVIRLFTERNKNEQSKHISVFHAASIYMQHSNTTQHI